MECLFSQTIFFFNFVLLFSLLHYFSRDSYIKFKITVLPVLLAFACRVNTLKVRTEKDIIIIIIIISLLSPHYSYFLLETSLLPFKYKLNKRCITSIESKNDLGKLNDSKPYFYQHVDDRAGV